MREFDTGATRDSDDSKLDYEGFINPIALERYAVYMHKHRLQADGKLRDSDNWQKGIPCDAYMKSLLRHVMDMWIAHRYTDRSEDSEAELMTSEEIEEFHDTICAVIFNAFGYLSQDMKLDD